MRTECIAAVAEAIGRPISNKEAAHIERRIKEGMGNRARLDPAAWRGLSKAERMQAGADEAGQSLLADAAKKKQRVALAIRR
jgi:hypothetical protein